MNATKRKWGANLQKVRVRIDEKFNVFTFLLEHLKIWQNRTCLIIKKEPLGSFFIIPLEKAPVKVLFLVFFEGI